MIISMTGYGTAAGEYKGRKIKVEVKSLNSKTGELKTKLPYAYREKEMEVRSLINSTLERGKIDFALNIERADNEVPVRFNPTLVRQYHHVLSALSKELNDHNPFWLPTILTLPEVMKSEEEEADLEEWAYVAGVITAAMDSLIAFRKSEGEALFNDLIMRAELIAGFLDEVERISPERTEQKREKIMERLRELEGDPRLDAQRLEQEVIFYIEKLDITEEVVRLRTHIDYFKETLNAENSQGKKLGFISQEMGREINTIGSKANHAGIQRLVVRMKDELEKIKEQLSNVL
ncbi:MAG: YicC family protein [Flavobacteriales bacterium]|nr:YicC family protein [Flavobacteriales bacterium]